MRVRIKQHWLIILLVGAASIMGAFSLGLGSAALGAGDIWNGLFSPGDDPAAIIVRELRLPRLLLGLLVGAVLGLSGAALQGLLKNPLAEPGVIGVSASAALGAVIALYFGLAAVGSFVIPAFAMMGAFVATLVLYWVALRDASVLTLILVGIAVNSLAGSLTSLALNLSPNPFALNDILLWLLGSLSNRSMDDVYLMMPFALSGGALLLSTSRAQAALTLGDDVASSLGFDVKSVRIRVILGTSLAVGAAVASVGAIGFVGLIVPHFLRPFVGQDPGRLMVPSALGGALLLVMADMAVRLMPGGQELRLGVVTALIGAPFFLYLVIVTRRAMR
jgi:iron complex transport system permease protein